MSERDLDSSINDYIEIEPLKNYVKQQEWDMAIGFQEVDNLKPSKYLKKLLQENVTGEKTIYEVEHELKQYCAEKDKTNKTIQDEFECDLVSTGIVQLLEENNKVDFSKYERIINNDSALYGDCKVLKQSLDYDITLEKNKKYPFREGNTRTIALFIEKYLESLGYKVDNSMFKEKSVYYRNTLVRSNYLNIKQDNSFLIKFYENLLLGKK